MTVNTIHRETLAVLLDHINQNGYAPSIRELGVLLGLSSSDSVQKRLDVLEKAGMIERVGPRAIRIIE
jgi:repressor LexA